jgi:hypothetical protein
MKMMDGAKGGLKESEAAKYQQAYEENNKKFQQYLTDKSYKAFNASRLSILRIQKPYNNNVFTEIKDLEISIYREDKTAKTIGYHYEMKLNQINKDTKKIETVNRSGNLTVIKENGYWKIVDVISR